MNGRPDEQKRREKDSGRDEAHKMNVSIVYGADMGTYESANSAKNWLAIREVIDFALSLSLCSFVISL